MSVENTHYGADAISHMLRKCKSVFFIGIGGINMSSLAHITFLHGYQTGGSDRCESDLTHRLADAGIEIFYGHDRNHIEDYDAVVYTVAISPENPEYLRAKERGIPCISRADYLGYLMMKYPVRIGISGMHGKSTCTSICAEMLMACGCDPTVLSGAELAGMGGAYRIGQGDVFLFEACEYMDSFLDFNPSVAVILNIEPDHLDYFKDINQIRTSFASFASLTGGAARGGCVILNADDGNILSAVAAYDGQKLSFGIWENADFRAVDITGERGKYRFTVTAFGKPYMKIALSVPGYHHIYNALAAAAVAYRCGVEPEKAGAGISAFCGAKRRMEYKGEINGAAVYDDYGHHPTEVRATLSGARAMTGDVGEKGGRLWCVFQPHTYSRTKALFAEFCSAFGDADRILLLDIYAARETDDLGVSSALLAEGIGEKAYACESFCQAADILRNELVPGDVVVIMGAGNVEKVLDELRPERGANDERM